MTGLLDRYAARKRKRQVSSSSESDPTQAAGSNQPALRGDRRCKPLSFLVLPSLEQQIKRRHRGWLEQSQRRLARF